MVCDWVPPYPLDYHILRYIRGRGGGGRGVWFLRLRDTFYKVGGYGILIWADTTIPTPVQMWNPGPHTYYTGVGGVADRFLAEPYPPTSK